MSGVGVIIGRFQVSALHSGHRFLIERVLAEEPEVLVMLGVPASLPTVRDPLSFEQREVMIKTAYPQVAVAPLPDKPSDQDWSAAVDRLIEARYPGQDTTLYGSSGSCLDSYGGQFATREIPASVNLDEAVCRQPCAHPSQDSPAFREGIIHFLSVRPPVTYPTVDIAILGPDGTVLLAGKDTDEGKLRFVGGFVDAAADTSYEDAARRETYEEIGDVKTTDWRCLGSSEIDDWRYRGTPDRIVTTFFRARFVSGLPRPQDDISRVCWMSVDRLPEVLVAEHQGLGQMLLDSLAAGS